MDIRPYLKGSESKRVRKNRMWTSQTNSMKRNFSYKQTVKQTHGQASQLASPSHLRFWVDWLESLWFPKLSPRFLCAPWAYPYDALGGACLPHLGYWFNTNREVLISLSVSIKNNSRNTNMSVIDYNQGLILVLLVLGSPQGCPLHPCSSGVPLPSSKTVLTLFLGAPGLRSPTLPFIPPEP